MSPLRTIARDLVERRLWPLAALLVAGLVAIPVVFLRPQPNALSGSSAPAAAAPAPAPVNPAASTASTASPSDPTADPSVALTSSPFAAAFSGGLNLPPSMAGLLKATKGSDDRRAVADAPLRDPFAAALASAAAPAASTSTSGSSATPASATPSSTPAASSSSSSSATSSTQATPSSTAPRAVGQGSRASAPTQSSTPSSPATPSSTPVSSQTPASSGTSSSSDSWRVFRADVSFGSTQTLPTDTDATRLTAYPSAVDPMAIYLGVMRGGWGAVFMLRDDVRPVGSPSCRPRKQICTWVILHPGESVTLNAKDASGTVTPYTLKLAKIREDKVAEAAAKAAYAKANAGGRCLLGAMAAYHYDAATGTLAPRPEMKDCRYQGDTATAGTNAAVTTGSSQASDYRVP